MAEQKSKAEKQNKKVRQIHSFYSHPHVSINQPPISIAITSQYKSAHSSNLPTVSFYSSMNMVLLASMVQANKCGSVSTMENPTYTSNLVQELESASKMTPTTSTVPSTLTINQKEARNPKNDQLQQILLFLSWPTYIEPKAKRNHLGTLAKETQ